MPGTGKYFNITLLLFLFILGRGGIFAQDPVVKDGYQRFYYPGGALSSEGTIRNGNPDGYWKSYNQNGSLKSEGNRRNFQLDSLWKFYDGDGRLVQEIHYLDGKKNGIRTTYREKEIVRESFRNDLLDGPTRHYYPNGRISLEIPFTGGLEQGYGKEYDSAGMIITLTEYKKGFLVDRQRINRKDGQGRKHGKWYEFYGNGNIKTETGYRNGLKNGIFKEFAENGDLVKILKYSDDQLVQDAVEVRKPEIRNEYYPNGRLKVSGIFRDGIPDGVMRQFDSLGNVEKAFIYKNGAITGEGIIRDDGERQGFWKELYPDGSVRAEGNYDKGKPVGEWKYFYPGGKLEQKGKYGKNGKPDGTWKWYFENGDLQCEENYRGGEKDGLSVTYDETGTVIAEGEYIEGREDGPWFEQTGDTYVKGSYREGQRNGLWTYYYLNRGENVTDSVIFYRGNFIDDNPDGKHVTCYEDGKTKTEGRYINGRKEGEWYHYNEDGTLFLVITYRGGVETKYDGVKIKPPYEKEDE